MFLQMGRNKLGLTLNPMKPAGQEIVDVAQAPARQAGEVVVDEGEAHLKIIGFLEELKVI